MMILLFLFLSLASAQFNCQTLVCDPCLLDAIPVDFFFVIDASISMKAAIAGVGAGLTKLLDEIEAKDVDALMWVLYQSHDCLPLNQSDPWYGRAPEILVDASTNKTELEYVFTTVKAINNEMVEDLHGYHGIFEAEVSVDIFTTATSCSAFTAVAITNVLSHTLTRNTCVAGNPPGSGNNTFVSIVPHLKPGKQVERRQNARPFVFLIGDEDDDAPYYVQNRPPGMNCGDPEPTQCVFVPPPYNTTFCGLTDFSTYDTPWGAYINETAQKLIDLNAIVYMFVSPKHCFSTNPLGYPCETYSWGSHFQYGLPECDISAADLSEFNREATMACLEQKGVHGNLQYQMLQAGMAVRVFDIPTLVASDDEFIEGVMREAVGEVAQCTAKRRKRAQSGDLKRAETDCLEYRCDAEIGCYSIPLCNENCAQCLINGTCYKNGESNPNSTCEFCNADLSKTQWTLCGPGGYSSADNCTLSECNIIGSVETCEWNVPQCTVECGKCDIADGLTGCVAAGTLKLGTSCELCMPNISFTEWTEVCSCEPACLNGGKCQQSIAGGTAGVCDCGGTGFLGSHCEQEEVKIVCTPPCQNGGQCLSDRCICPSGLAPPVCDGPPDCGGECQHNGSCIFDYGKYKSKCICPDILWGGPLCDVSIPLGSSWCQLQCEKECAGEEKGGFKECVCSESNEEPVSVTCKNPLLDDNTLWYIVLGVGICVCIVIIFAAVFSFRKRRRLKMLALVMQAEAGKARTSKKRKSSLDDSTTPNDSKRASSKHLSSRRLSKGADSRRLSSKLNDTRRRSQSRTGPGAHRSKKGSYIKPGVPRGDLDRVPSLYVNVSGAVQAASAEGGHDDNPFVNPNDAVGGGQPIDYAERTEGIEHDDFASQRIPAPDDENTDAMVTETDPELEKWIEDKTEVMATGDLEEWDIVQEAKKEAKDVEVQEWGLLAGED